MTILERKSRFYLAKKVPSKSADAVTKSTIEMLMPFKECVHTITADNGENPQDMRRLAQHWILIPFHIKVKSDLSIHDCTFS
ncbi:hypothetical protein S4054249_16080 [Pseudoalteromonas luteoviolacea]|nr:hypothetical protein S4054249_16080 [Pseudoalteromonas luteoviolacea]AOT14184.1 hypothetical protein S40542_16050 [Pseudoalteromonas luteoviolacea]AOT19100.1 hypothetical protein S4054_16055 [Pseudoalteromonas luteoviolacea]